MHLNMNRDQCRFGLVEGHQANNGLVMAKAPWMGKQPTVYCHLISVFDYLYSRGVKKPIKSENRLTTK